MEDELRLPVTYKDQEMSFPLRIVPRGYVYQFVVLIDGVEVIYERDEGGALRALIAPADDHTAPPQLPEQGLLAAIGEVIEQISSL